MNEQASTPSESPTQPDNFDPVVTGRAIDAAHDRMEAAHKRSAELDDRIPAARAKIEAANGELREILNSQDDANADAYNARKELVAELVKAKANVTNFKAFVETHTHISLATAKRMLAEAAGKGDHIREQSRTNTAAHRARKKAEALTGDVRATDGDADASNVVKLSDHRPAPDADPILDDHLHAVAQENANKTGRVTKVVRDGGAVFEAAPQSGEDDGQTDDEYVDPRPVKTKAEIDAFLDGVLTVVGEISPYADNPHYTILPFQVGPDADRELHDKAVAARKALDDLVGSIEEANGNAVWNEIYAERQAGEHRRRSEGAKRGAETRKRRQVEHRRKSQVREMIEDAQWNAAFPNSNEE